MTSHEYTFQELAIKAKLKMRVATPSDIRKLEWNGQYTRFRNLFRRAYLEQRNGRRLMLVMTFNDYPIARLFIQFKSPTSSIADGKRRGYIYSFTVMEPFRNLGIGTRMLTTAETILRQRGFRIVTISVAKENRRALRLYKREGYRIYGEDEGNWQYHDHEGTLHQVHEPSYLMKKTL